jgi:glycosyltransferase involved in cell wall biosynthesis
VARVLVISLSDLGSDARVDRQIEALASEHEVVAAGFGEPGHGARGVLLAQSPRMTPSWLWRRLAMELLRTVALDLASYWVAPDARSWRETLAEVRPDLVVANDMSAVPLAFASAQGAPVVIDLHEYAPREHEQHLLWRLAVAPQITRLLRRYLPRAAEAITVNGPIADAYAENFGCRPAVVTNAARLISLAPSPSQPGRIRLVHHGVAARGRRLEDMIELVKRLDERFSFDMYLVGEPGYVGELRELAAGEARIEIHPPLPMNEIAAELNRYDVGLYLLAPNSFNNLYALPNKFFDFVQARLAVAIGPSPAMAELALRHGFGVVSETFEPAAMIVCLQALEPARVEELKRAADAAAGELNAERNAEIVRMIVARALARGSADDEPAGGVIAPQPARP